MLIILLVPKNMNPLKCEKKMVEATSVLDPSIKEIRCRMLQTSDVFKLDACIFRVGLVSFLDKFLPLLC